MSTKIIKLTGPPKTYHKLCGLLMPRKIRSDSELEAVQKIIDVLAVLPRRTLDQNDYLETWAELVEAYEEQSVKIGKKQKPFVVKSQHMGLMPGVDHSKANKLADDMEIDAFIEEAKGSNPLTGKRHQGSQARAVISESDRLIRFQAYITS